MSSGLSFLTVTEILPPDAVVGSRLPAAGTVWAISAAMAIFWARARFVWCGLFLTKSFIVVTASSKRPSLYWSTPQEYVPESAVLSARSASLRRSAATPASSPGSARTWVPRLLRCLTAVQGSPPATCFTALSTAVLTVGSTFAADADRGNVVRSSLKCVVQSASPPLSDCDAHS